MSQDPLARAGLVALLAEVGGLSIVGQSALYQPWDDLVATFRPDVILWDLGWEPEEALAGLAEWPDVGVPVLALVPEEGTATASFGAGGAGVLSREASLERLTAALHATALGLWVADPALGSNPMSPEEGVPELEEHLTPREVEVLQWMAEGLSNRAIAHRLGISEHTVKFHVNAILGKLGAQSRTEAVVRAARMGLLLL